MTLNRFQAEQAAAILNEECGANLDDAALYGFIGYFTTERAGFTEWRFGGSLGFGGKLRLDGFLYVTCYPEDVTEARRKARDRANVRLRGIVAEKDSA